MNIFKRIIRIICCILFLGSFTAIVLVGFHDDTLEVFRYEYDTTKITTGSFKAVIVSDLHHRSSLNFQGGANLVNAINEEKPDAIFLCGDLVDDWNDKELKNQKELLDGINKKPTYYITGNHEHRSPYFKDFLKLVDERSWVTYVDDICVSIDDNVQVFGLHDASFDEETRKEIPEHKFLTIDEQLEEFKNKIDNTKLNIIMTHNPANAKKIKQYGYDAIFAGHTHGGQFRIGNWSPFTLLHGFNSYNAGEYKIDNNENQRIYVSKGLGYSAMFPIRVNCRPDILSINFK